MRSDKTKQNGMGKDGMDRMEWNGLEWDWMEVDWMDGMECKGGNETEQDRHVSRNTGDTPTDIVFKEAVARSISHLPGRSIMAGRRGCGRHST